MDLRITTEPQEGATYDDLLAAARQAEACGYGGFFRSDHYLHMDSDGGPGPTDAWITLAGLARDTTTIRLGTLVTSATFRLPGVLAIEVAGVDQMSGGRVEFGLGAGWFEEEHTAYGIEFPDVSERFDRFEEQLAIITGLWATPAGERYSFAGQHYRLTDAPALAKPVQSPVPLIMGGKGKRRTPALAARYASEFNTVGVSPEVMAEQNARVVTACLEISRDPASIVWSTYQTVLCGRTEAEVARRAEAKGMTIDELRAAGVILGTPSQVVDGLGRYAAAGADRVYLEHWDLADHDFLELVAEQVAPQLV